ncbi:copper transporter [Brevibacterium sp. 5221]|uniref:Copper transporter n=1 Tax=Brevibacterium rongguiense TaxID=2695267 RepID=A0A6N9H6L2_9MICO|nr:copper transporter [Brevibacterium rongguiense]MYM19599.1 copper transporter [Brevibacterium rongguiense]
MIDFRYHLVSLISVFLALAVGIVLGAGPLKQPIGESLQSQVESLRTDRDKLRGELDTAHGDVQKLNDFVVAEAPSQLRGALKGRTVAVVHAADADADQLAAVQQRLREANAKTVDAGGLTAKTFASQERDDLVAKLRELDTALPKDPGTALTTALAKALSAERGSQPYSAQTAKDVLTAFQDAGRFKGGQAQKADAVVFVAGAQTAAQDEGATPTAGAAQSIPEDLVAFAAGLGTRIATVVEGTSGNASSGLVATLRADNADVTTTDGLELGAGPVIGALAVKERLATNKNQAYGFADGTASLVPGIAKS